jgi:hypothetical protein
MFGKASKSTIEKSLPALPTPPYSKLRNLGISDTFFSNLPFSINIRYLNFTVPGEFFAGG